MAYRLTAFCEAVTISPSILRDDDLNQALLTPSQVLPVISRSNFNEERKKKSILAIGLVIVGYWYYQDSQPQVWGDENNESYITIKGIKPADAKVDAWAIFGASGKNCKAKTWSAASGWSDGANVKWHITHNFSTNHEQYELRIPYLQYYDSFDCDVTLGI